LHREARSLLAGDVVVRSMKPMPQDVTASIDRWVAAHPGSASTPILEMATVVTTPRGDSVASSLVELKAVGPGWPFYGKVETEPARPLAELLEADGVLVAPDLAKKLGLTTGSRLDIGGKPFTVRGRILSEPDRLGVGIDLGPRLLVSRATLATTGLDTFGSRIDRKILIKLPDAAPPKDAGGPRQVARSGPHPRLRRARRDVRGRAARPPRSLQERDALPRPRRPGVARARRHRRRPRPCAPGSPRASTRSRS
jgi:predicted lysophospholipase L1 biosynthesis ABC-type transport system permease subunit